MAPEPTVSSEFDSLVGVWRDPGRHVGADAVAPMAMRDVFVSIDVPDADWSGTDTDLHVVLESSADDGRTWRPEIGCTAGKGIPAGPPTMRLQSSTLRGKRCRVVLTQYRRMRVGVNVKLT